jgi:hypothetical protein
MSCYYTGAGNGSLCYEIYNKDRLRPDIEVVNNAAEEFINLQGQKVSYFVSTFTPLCADNTYGEQPTSVYYTPKILKLVIELNESSLALSKFGFNAEDEITAYVSIQGYRKVFADDDIYDRLQQEVAPKSGDVFQMVEYGNDRPGNRAGNFFEVTQRRDQDISSNQMNPLGGHYLWQIKAKRLEYSFEPGLSGERGNDQVYDDTFSGIVSSNFSDDIYDYIPSHLSPENLTIAIVDHTTDVVDEVSPDYINDENDLVDGGTI